MYTDKPIKFIYLIYNPEPLVFKNEKAKVNHGADGATDAVIVCLA